MSIFESQPDLILSLAKFTAALLLGMAVAPLIKRPALRAAFWTAMFLILPTMILVTHGRSILNILPVPNVMPTVTVQMESTQVPASTPVTPPAPIVAATPLAEITPAISTVPTNNDITKSIQAPPLTPPTPARKTNWLAAIYFSGLIASLLPILISILRLRFALKKSAGDTAIEVWSMIRPEEAKVVPLYLTDSPAAPFTCGLMRAEVFLPASSDEWSMRRLRSTLYHESAHISRRDPLVRMLASLVRALFWFHPLVWLAHRRLVAAQEEACDEIALAAGIPADEYAEDLLEAAKHAQGQLGHGLALARWSQLGSRIRIILQTNTKEIKQMNKKTIAIVTLGIAALCVVISSLGFHSQNRSDTQVNQEEEKPKLSSTRKSSSSSFVADQQTTEKKQSTSSNWKAIAQNIESSGNRESLTELLSQMSEAELIKAYDELSSLNLSKKQAWEIGNRINEILAEKNPELALDRFLEESGGTFSTHPSRDAFKNFLKRDHAAAVAWLDKHIANGSFPETITGQNRALADFEMLVILPLVKSNPAEAARRLNQMGDLNKLSILDDAFDTIGLGDKDAFASFVRNTVPEEDREHRMQYYISGKAKGDLQKAQEYIEHFGATPQERINVLETITLRAFSDQFQYRKVTRDEIDSYRTTIQSVEPSLVNRVTGGVIAKAIGRGMTFDQAAALATEYQAAGGGDDVLIPLLASHTARFDKSVRISVQQLAAHVSDEKRRQELLAALK